MSKINLPMSRLFSVKLGAQNSACFTVIHKLESSKKINTPTWCRILLTTLNGEV